jgi:CRISPR-associated endonuclease/helicase Cas3
MTISDFPKFFAAVNGGREPFQWQVRLAGQVVASGWPGSLNVPTGAGKSSLLDIAVFTLALQAGHPPLERTAPLRIFFVIDRRVVVDQAYRRARHLSPALHEPAEPIIAEVAERLRSFGGDLPLADAELRGGMYREHTWADAPNQPLICVSTVDQVGSRLLFRGYGVNGRQRPIQAAFIALDSLIILDEAHFSQPFAETVIAAQRWMEIEGRAIAPGVGFVQMSATLETDNTTFRLTPDERKEKRLAPRLEATKLATLAKTPRLETDAAAAALKLLERHSTVAVVVNRVASARSIFEHLKQNLADGEVILLTGRIREWDRNRLLKKYQGRLNPDRVRSDEGRLCVVATQTIEVGADFDFDGLVTEVAAFDALRQRLGRLDRLGMLANTEVVILRRDVEDSEDQHDPIYGEALDRTWKWLISCGWQMAAPELWHECTGRFIRPPSSEEVVKC